MSVDVGWLAFAALFVVLAAVPASQAVAEVRERRFTVIPMWALIVCASIYLAAHALIAATR